MKAATEAEHDFQGHRSKALLEKSMKYQVNVHVAFQRNAWVDVDYLLEYVQTEFAPYKKVTCGDKPAVLFMDFWRLYIRMVFTPFSFLRT